MISMKTDLKATKIPRPVLGVQIKYYIYDMNSVLSAGVNSFHLVQRTLMVMSKMFSGKNKWQWAHSFATLQQP